MIRTILLFIAGLVYDFLVIILLPLALIFSLVNKKLYYYFKSRSSLPAFFHLRKKKISMFFYCSSIGEYEQALPLINELRSKGEMPHIFFHSINGVKYAQGQKEYSYSITPLDLFTFWFIIFYFIKPKQTIINRHEFWPGFFLAALINSQLIVINAVDGRKGFIRNIVPNLVLNLSKKVFYASPCSKVKPNRVESGDTRLDRLLERQKENQEELNLISSLKKRSTKRSLVIGNAYPADFKILTEAVSQKQELLNTWNIIVIPSRPEIPLTHNNSRTINKLEELAESSESIKVFPVFGKLFQIYSFGDLAWVGGGFCCGVHNTLEPYFFKQPIISGPFLNYQPDAIYLKSKKVLRTMGSSQELIEVLNNFSEIRNPDFQSTTSPTDLILKSIKNIQ